MALLAGDPCQPSTECCTTVVSGHGRAAELRRDAFCRAVLMIVSNVLGSNSTKTSELISLVELTNGDELEHKPRI